MLWFSQQQSFGSCCEASRFASARIGRLAEVLGVTVEALFSSGPPAPSQRGGPLGRAKRIFEEVSALPRKKQKRILDVVEDLLKVHGEESE
jgi:hypothetical protein